MNVRDNAFPKGEPWHFEVLNWRQPAPFGIHLNTLTLNPEIGPESVLILREERKFLSELKEHGSFQLNIKSGAVRTSVGPVLFMLWWFPPVVLDTAYAIYELLLESAPSC